jgi:hypothetical protein
MRDGVPWVVEMVSRPEAREGASELPVACDAVAVARVERPNMSMGSRLFPWLFPLLSVLVTVAAVSHRFDATSNAWWQVDWHYPILLALGCFLPNLLGGVAAALAAQARTIDLPTLSMVHSSPLLPEELPATPEAQQDWLRARRTTASEWDRMKVLGTHVDLHAKIWGFLGTLAISSCLMLHASIADAHVFNLTLAVAGAVAICFVLGFAQVLIRSGAHDASTALFSTASRDLLIAVVVTIVAATLLVTKEYAPVGAVGLGLCAGLIGPRALVPLRERAAGVLGVKLSAEGGSLPLGMIEGLTDEVVERLAEDGLDSVHALAFTNTPRIYFATPYSWERIADWQAQAVLLEHLGLARFAKFKEQSPIRGIQAALRLMAEDKLENIFARALGLDNGPEAQLIFTAVRSCPTLRTLRLYGTYGDALLRAVSNPPTATLTLLPRVTMVSDVVPRPDGTRVSVGRAP